MSKISELVNLVKIAHTEPSFDGLKLYHQCKAVLHTCRYDGESAIWISKRLLDDYNVRVEPVKSGCGKIIVSTFNRSHEVRI